MARSSVDVFSFLVDDNDEDKKNSSPPVQGQPPVKEDTPAHTDESDDESSAVRSLHSDSGVSMASASAVTPSTRGRMDDRLPTVIETPQEKAVTNAPSKGRETHVTRLRLTYPDIPQATHRRRHDSISPPQSPRTDFTPRRTPYSDKNADPEFGFPHVAPLSGYDLVADSLAQGRLPPVFRRFQRVNFRILLQLQDEIIEMEEQLASLDVADTRSRLRPDGSASPASRRLQWQRAQSELPAQRLEVLGRLYIKLEQYCR